MIRRRALVFCLLCLLALPTQAARWRQVGVAPASGARVEVDDASLDSHEYVATGWIRVTYPAPRKKYGVPLQAYHAHWQVNCENHTYWMSDAWGYGPDLADPVPLSSGTQSWLTPAPDSEEAVAADALCQETRSLFDKVIEGIGRAIGGH